MAWVKKWPQLFVRELSREVFSGETVDFFRLVRAFSFEQLARTLINSGPKLKLVGGHAKGSPTFFAQRPETTHSIPGEAGRDC
jgi:hypothetical protein